MVLFKYFRPLVKDFSHRIIEWYESNQRDLPWRHTRDPYKIWLSEIILQQTRVNQGLSYYIKFTSAYPDLKALATAPRDEILKLWQGLGYYSRANNLHDAAKTLLEEYGGRFPETPKELMDIKGIGSYTSAAIASLAFDYPAVVVDGNVFRVLARIFGIYTDIQSHAARKEFENLGNALMDKKQPGTFNQAIMEFGALQCTPKKPDCAHCIFMSQCYAYSKNKQEFLPVKKPRIKVRSRYFYYFLLESNHGKTTTFYLRKRDDSDIWKNLYDLPLVESAQEETVDDVVLQQLKEGVLKDTAFNIHGVSDVYKHKLTHQHIMGRFIHIKLEGMLQPSLEKSLHLVGQNELENYPVPRLIEQYFHDKGLIEMG